MKQARVTILGWGLTLIGTGVLLWAATNGDWSSLVVGAMMLVCGSALVTMPAGFRAIGSVLGGVASIAMLTLAAYLVATNVVFSANAENWLPYTLLPLFMLVLITSSIVGGWVACKIAGDEGSRPAKSLALALVMAFLASIVPLRDSAPLYFFVTMLLFLPAGAWFGGTIHQRSRHVH